MKKASSCGLALGPALVLSLTTLCGAQPRAAAESQKSKDIRRLLDLTGAGNLGVQVMGQMISQFRTTLPQVPARFWDDFMKEAKAEELVTLVVPVYDRHLTHDEIKQLIAFYETPVGRKVVTTLPLIMQESMEAGRQWGEQLGQKIQLKLKQQGYG